MTPRKVLLRIQRLLKVRTSALVSAVDPDRFEWSPEAYLLAENFDAATAANWQRSGDKHLKRPKPHPRPGDERRKTERAEAQFEAWRATKQ